MGSGRSTHPHIGKIVGTVLQQIAANIDDTALQMFAPTVAEPRTDGPGYADPNVERQRFMAAVYLEISSFALAAARSPCRGTARRCAAAFGLDSARACRRLRKERNGDSRP